jgi:hypothetical protein
MFKYLSRGLESDWGCWNPIKHYGALATHTGEGLILSRVITRVYEVWWANGLAHVVHEFLLFLLVLTMWLRGVRDGRSISLNFQPCYEVI